MYIVTYAEVNIYTGLLVLILPTKNILHGYNFYIDMIQSLNLVAAVSDRRRRRQSLFYYSAQQQ